jgi:heme-degrading monooxygenase HmoA
MIRLFVRHNVSNYDAWRKVYDGFDPTRRSMGVTGHAVYRGATDPNDVTVTHDFDSAEKAKAFVASAELRQAMGNAGVAGEPQIWITASA